jgi:hypothetical protein
MEHSGTHGRTFVEHLKDLRGRLRIFFASIRLPPLSIVRMDEEFSKRFRAVLARQGFTLTTFGARIGVNPTHLSNVLAGRSVLSDGMRQKLQEGVGQEGWAYALGETDVLKAGAAA